MQRHSRKCNRKLVRATNGIEVRRYLIKIMDRSTHTRERDSSSISVDHKMMRRSQRWRRRWWQTAFYSQRHSKLSVARQVLHRRHIYRRVQNAFQQRICYAWSLAGIASIRWHNIMIVQQISIHSTSEIGCIDAFAQHIYAATSFGIFAFKCRESTWICIVNFYESATTCNGSRSIIINN